MVETIGPQCGGACGVCGVCGSDEDAAVLEGVVPHVDGNAGGG